MIWFYFLIYVGKYYLSDAGYGTTTLKSFSDRDLMVKRVSYYLYPFIYPRQLQGCKCLCIMVSFPSLVGVSNWWVWGGHNWIRYIKLIYPFIAHLTNSLGKKKRSSIV